MLLLTLQQAGRSILSERVQALNRASNNMERSRRLMRQARLDGLGDRDRSLSPEGGGTTWDTLLTSITPDPQPPSAGSSFASASASASAAAASSSSSSGPASASTSMTSLGRTEDSPTIRDCDISDSGTNTEDEEGDIAVLEEVNRTGGDPFWRIYAEVVRERAVARHSRTGDIEHLGGMHRIISRLAEREDIPDEWWAGAGLSRNFRREPTS